MDWKRLEHLVEEASDLPAERRASFLRERCSDDTELLGEALSLLEHVEPGEHYFSALGADLAAPPESAGGLKPSDRVGPYELLEPLGEGGMGRVWLAQQREPVRRRVALKVIKVGIDTREVVARFATERQALAVMDHPGIARVFDAGTTDDGRPYFVMEAIRGVPITEYCDDHRLDTQERIRLFIRVCDAVQHAHLKGVVHRDLKPSNMLVAEHESGPVPKVIDFGVAKAVGESATDKTLVTSLGQMVGTPAYMSPEQAERSGLDVDSRTDVYALGVVLYELLVGALPFAAETLRRPALTLQFLLGDLDVPRPSARLSDLDDTQVTVTTARATDARTLRRQLRGDLDWIVMKAMEKDRERRYETANALAQDLRRYLVHEPVIARPPTAAYELRRFVRRNRVAVVGAVATACALLLGFAGTSIGLVRARQAEAAAQRQAATAEAVSEFLASLFSTQTPAQTLGRELSGSEILDRGADRVRSELADQPLVQAEVLEAIGDVYLRMGRQREAVPLLDESLEIRERELGPFSLEVASSIAARAGAPGDDEQSEELLNRALETFEREEGEASVGAVRVRQRLAELYQRAGRFEEAEAHLLDAERAIRMLPPDRPIPEVEYQLPEALLGRLKGSMANLLAAQGRWAEETRLREEAVEILQRTLEPDNPYLAFAYRDLAWRYLSSERNHEALEMQERTVASLELVFGPKAREVATALITLGRVKQHLGRFDESEGHYLSARAIYDSIDGSAALSTAEATVSLGLLELARGRPARAEERFWEALPAHRAVATPGSASLYSRLATALERQGRLEEAIEWSARSVDALHTSQGWAHPSAGSGRAALARLYLAQDRAGLAAKVHLDAADTIQSRYGSASVEFGLQAMRVAQFYDDRDEHDLALDWIERSVAVLHASDAELDDRLDALRMRVAILGRVGRFETAIRAQRRLVDQVEALGEDHTWDLFDVLWTLGSLYERTGRPEDMRITYERALGLLRQVLDEVEDTTRLQFAALATTSHRVGDLEAARRYHQRQLDTLSPGTDSFLQYMIAIRTGLEEILAKLDDVDARVANFAAAIEGFDRAQPHRRAVMLDHELSVQRFRTFLGSYEDLLRELGRGREADAVAERIEALTR